MIFSLVGVDGNAYSILGYTMKAMKYAGYTPEEIDVVLNRAKSSDYSNLICVCAKAIDEVNERIGE